MRNLQEQVKKAFCYQKLFWPFSVWMNFSSDLKNFANPRPSASNFKIFSQSLEQFFLTVGQNNLGNKIPFLHERWGDLECWLLHEAKKFLFFENVVSKFLGLLVKTAMNTIEKNRIPIWTKLFQSIILGIRLF